MVESVIFWAFALLTIGAALGAVLHRSVVYAALFLIVVFLSIAGFFILNNADFLAIAQVIIYAVGLTIILLFAIMFTGDNRFEVSRMPRAYWVMSAIVVAYTLALLLRAGTATYPEMPVTGGFMQGMLLEGSSEMLGTTLFKWYALPFEVASVLLLVAMIGAIIIAKKRFVDTEEVLGTMKLPLELESAPRPDAVAALEASGNLPEPGHRQDADSPTQSPQDVGVQ